MKEIKKIKKYAVNPSTNDNMTTYDTLEQAQDRVFRLMKKYKEDIIFIKTCTLNSFDNTKKLTVQIIQADYNTYEIIERDVE